MDFDVRRMLLLAEVARHGSLTAAAGALNYTPSAVSQQIARLETEVGQPLVARGPRGVALTEAGRVLADHADRVKRQLRAAGRSLDDLAGLRSGILRIGTFPTIAASLLPLVVRTFRTRHPDVALNVHSARNAELVELLESREVELSLLWDHPWRRLDEPGISTRHLLDDPTFLVVARTHPLAGRRAVTFAELAEEHWIVRADHPVAELLERSCRAAGFEPRISYRAHDYQEAQAMAAVGLGIALAPRLALTGLRGDVTTVGLGRDAPSRRILLAHAREHRPSPAAHEIEKVFAETARTLSAGQELPGALHGPPDPPS
jgi:DNA-binding transcriptional LysR family regulator